MFSCPKIATGGQASQPSKLLEIKGYEVFRVDRVLPTSAASDGSLVTSQDTATHNLTASSTLDFRENKTLMVHDLALEAFLIVIQK